LNLAFYVQNMSLRVIASAVAAVAVAKLVLNSYALRRYEDALVLLQVEIFDSKQRLRKLEEAPKGYGMPNIVVDIMYDMQALIVKHNCAVEKVNGIHNWLSMSAAERFMSWPPMLMHV
jgi:hypothetical protein